MVPGWWPKISNGNDHDGCGAGRFHAAFNTPLGGMCSPIEDSRGTHISISSAHVHGGDHAGVTAQALLSDPISTWVIRP